MLSSHDCPQDNQFMGYFFTNRPIWLMECETNQERVERRKTRMDLTLPMLK